MPEMQRFVWLLPILFVFHDFEEIIFVKAWIGRNKALLAARFPKLAGRLLPHFEKISTPAFALGVAEEFILLSLVTYVSAASGRYEMWLGLFAAFTLHLIMHCAQTALIRRYVPALATSAICLPIAAYVLIGAARQFSPATVVIFTAAGLVLVAANLALIHKGMEVFEAWLQKYLH